jgi:hypothetical protein
MKNIDKLTWYHVTTTFSSILFLFLIIFTETKTTFDDLFERAVCKMNVDHDDHTHQHSINLKKQNLTLF